MKYGYARVSTSEQNLRRQLIALRERGCDKIFREKKSGKDKDRSALNTLLSVLEKGDVVVVVSLDRLGRKLSDLLKIVEELHTKGIQFVSIKENIDTTSPQVMLVFQVFGAIAQFERAFIKERQKEGIQAALADGVQFGRPSKIKDFDLFKKQVESGMSINDISDYYDISRQQVYNMLHKHGLFELYTKKLLIKSKKS